MTDAAPDKIIWIKPADYDPSIGMGSQLKPDASLAIFEAIDRRCIVMMFSAATGRGATL